MVKQAELAGVSFHRLPAALRRIDRPILHDERRPVGRRINIDREVLIGAKNGETKNGTAPLLRNQAEHPRYGAAARAEVEAFIHRTPGWQASAALEVGVVDMDAYRAWLRKRLNWDFSADAS